MSQDPLFSLFEQHAGLAKADASSPDALGAGEMDPREIESLHAANPQGADEARKLAEVCLRLRAESELKPAGDLWERLQERVRLYQETELPAATEEWENLADVSPQAPLEVPFADLFDLVAGSLDDSHAGAVERRIATSPEAQRSLRVAGQLSSVLNLLRSESELRATPDVYARFEGRVVAELQADAEKAAAEAAREAAAAAPSSEAPATLPMVPAQPTRRRRRRARPRVTWFSLAASVLLAFGVWHLMIVPRQMAGLWPFVAKPGAVPSSVADQVEQTQSLAELKQLSGQIAGWVGESILSFEDPEADGLTVSPATLANWHLAADLSRTPQGTDSLDTVKFLVRQPAAFERDAVPGRARDGAPSSLFAQMSLTSVAYAGPEEGPKQVRQSLRKALRAGDFGRAAMLAASRTEWDMQLVRAWSLAVLGRNQQEIHKVLSEVESTGVDTWPVAAQVFLAGFYRTIGEPETAMKRLEHMVDRVPELAFHLGQICDRQLHDETQAAAWYDKLDAGKYLAYRNFGLSQTKLVKLYEEKFARDLSKWERGGAGRASFSILPELGGDVLHQTEIADLPNVGYINSGSDAWKNYEIRLDFRFNEVAVGDPQIGVFGYFANEEENYRVAIGRESLGFRRRESRSWGGYETISWPKLEPRYPTLSLGVWYTLRFRLENVDGATRLAAKVWLRDGAEPEDWLLVSDDVQDQHYTSGRIGLLISNCRASVANVRVVGFGQGR